MESNKKVAILTNMVTPYRVPFFSELAKKVKHLDILICVDREVDRQWSVENSKDYRVIRLAGITVNLNKDNDAKRILHFRFGVIWYLLRSRPDTLIIGDASWTSFIAGLFCKLLFVKYVVWNEITTTSKVSSGLVAKLRKLLYRNATHCIASCKMAKDYLEQVGVDINNISIVNNAVDNDYFLKKKDKLSSSRESLRTELGIKEDAYVFIYVGQLISRKRVLETVESVAGLSKKCNVHLLVAGSGPLEQEMRIKAKNLGFSDITFCGYTNTDRLSELYTASDALILLSDDEPWGMVVNEAILFDCSIYATKSVAAAVELSETISKIILLNDANESINIIYNELDINKSKVCLPTAGHMVEGFLSEL